MLDPGGNESNKRCPSGPIASQVRNNGHMTREAQPQRSTGNPPDREFSFTDEYGIEIFCYEWTAQTPNLTGPITARPITDGPQAVIQLAHGIGEHARRYDWLATQLAMQGFTVIANDHRGHGKTGLGHHDGDHSKLGRLGPGGLRAAEAAIRTLNARIREQYPSVPLALFAHSWGSLMAQRIINEPSRLWDAIVLSGTAYRSPRYMESGPLNRQWREIDETGFAWLSRDLATADAFVADPLAFEANVLRLFGVADGVRLFGTPSSDVAADVPILIIGGTDDPLSRGDGVRKLVSAYRARGVRDVSLKLYQGARHELHNEVNRDEVVTDLVTWLIDRLDLE